MNRCMRTKVLLVTHCGVYPLLSGGSLAQYYFVDGLKDEVEYVYCTPIRSDKEKLNLDLLSSVRPDLKIYYFDEREKNKNSSLFQKLIAIKHRIVKSKRKVVESFSDDDYQDGYFYSVDHKFSNEYLVFINDVINKENIKIVQCDFYETIDIPFALPDTVKKIFVHHEVRSKRLELSYSHSPMPVPFKDFIINKNKAYEEVCLKQMDRVIVFNDDDARRLSPICKSIVVSPYAVPDELICERQSSKSFSHFIFLGGEGHTPNKLGLQWFLDEIYVPNIDAIKYELFVLGRWGETVKQKYLAFDKIHFLGFVDSVEPYYENAILINPVLSGAGLRTKILQTLVNKVPVLSTRFGAEGCFDADNSSHIGFFDNADEFKALLNTISDKELNMMAEKGFEYYQTQFGKEKLLSIRKSVYEF